MSYHDEISAAFACAMHNLCVALGLANMAFQKGKQPITMGLKDNTRYARSGSMLVGELLKGCSKMTS